MANILVMCTANICRSPVGEAIIQKNLQQQGLDDWHVHSAGTWAQNGRAASRFSVEVVQEEEGLNISAHQARMITNEILTDSDLVLCMTKNHAEALCIEFREHADKIYLLSQMVGDRKFDVSDPYGTAKPNYLRMYQQVKRLIEDGLPRIIELAS